MSSRAPLVSVLLPVYGGQRYIESAIASVLAQSERDFELIIGDDASPDESMAIAQRFASDPRVRFLRHATNRGLFPTLNDLFRASHGQLIRLWAQDDVMYPQCLAVETAFHARNPQIAMTYCASDAIDAAGAVISPTRHDDTPDVLTPAQASEIMFYYGSITGNISTVMLRRSTFERVGLFREDMKVSGDFEMWVRITEQLPIGFIREPLIRLRSHRAQLSRSYGIMPQFIREDRRLHETLLARLEPATQRFARRYLRRHVHRQYAQHAVRCLLDGDARTALETYRLIGELDRPLPVFFWWLATGNGRWLNLTPRLTSFGQ